MTTPGASVRWDAWRGNVVRLRAVEPGDWEGYWRDSFDSQSARENWQTHEPRGTQSVREWARNLSLERPADDSFRWAIESLADGSLAGMINTNATDPRHGTFRYGLGIFLRYRRRGFARDAILLVLRHYFEELRYEKVNANVYAFNDASLALHRSLGFVEEGRLRSMIYTDGQRHDEVSFGMTAAEFRELHGGAQPGPSDTD